MVDVGQFEKRLPVGIVLVEKRASFELQKPDIAAAVFCSSKPITRFLPSNYFARNAAIVEPLAQLPG